MRKLILTLTVLTVFTVVVFSQNLNKNTLCKKWYLEKYEIYWIDYEPETNEKNDYIYLKNDMTYVSVDKGIKTGGKWSFDDAKNYFILYDKNNEGLKFFVDEFKTNQMIVNVDIEEMDDVNIYFNTTKK